MSTRGRAIGIIIGTLLIGVAIGALVVGPLVARRHFKRIADWRTPKGFAARIEEIIEPDESQVEALRSVLSKHGVALEDVMSQHRAEVRGLVDSLHADLDTILTEEQKERLEKRMRHHRPPGFPHGPKERHGPPESR
jgi:hypothetical protein